MYVESQQKKITFLYPLLPSGASAILMRVDSIYLLDTICNWNKKKKIKTEGNWNIAKIQEARFFTKLLGYGKETAIVSSSISEKNWIMKEN